MLPVRVAFDPTLPAVVSVPELQLGEVRLVGGDPVPWRELGLSEQLLFEQWRAGLISFVAPAAGPEPAAELSDAELEVLTAPAGSGPTLAECREKFASVPQTAFGGPVPPPAPTTSKRRRR